VPVIPGINDHGESVRQMGAFAAALPRLDQVDLLPYHHTAAAKYQRLNKNYDLSEIRPPSDGRMTEIAETLSGFGLRVKIGG
jgi:pyruvate formate lyase activating enzyme